MNMCIECVRCAIGHTLTHIFSMFPVFCVFLWSSIMQSAFYIEYVDNSNTKSILGRSSIHFHVTSCGHVSNSCMIMYNWRLSLVNSYYPYPLSPPLFPHGQTHQI